MKTLKKLLAVLKAADSNFRQKFHPLSTMKALAVSTGKKTWQLLKTSKILLTAVEVVSCGIWRRLNWLSSKLKTLTVSVAKATLRLLKFSWRIVVKVERKTRQLTASLLRIVWAKKKTIRRVLVNLIIIGALTAFLYVVYRALLAAYAWTQETWYATAVAYGIFILMPILGGLFLWWAYRRRNPKTPTEPGKTAHSKTPPPPKDGWMTKAWNRGKYYALDTVLIVGGIGVCHILIWFLWPEFWFEWKALKGFFVYQICLGIGLTFFVVRLKALKAIGLIIITLSSIGIFLNVKNAVDVANDANMVLANDSSFRKSAPSKEELEKHPFLGRNAEVEVYTRKFFSGNLPGTFAGAMILTVQRESNFNQFEADGKTTYRGRKNSEDRGAAQINLNTYNYWVAKENLDWKKYNINTLEGNLNFALWLFRKEGFKPWRATSPVDTTSSQRPGQTGGSELPTSTRSIEYVVIAPVGAWSEPPFNVKGRPFWAIPQGNVLVRNERGQEFSVGPNNLPDIGTTETLQYKSLGDEPVKVIVTFR